MANFRFTIDIGAQYTQVTQARTAVQSLTTDLQRVRAGQTDLNVNSTEVRLAEVYLQALNNAIQKVEREGGDLGTVLAAEFQRLRVEANLTEQQIEELNRELERSEDAARRASSGLNALSRSAKIATQNIRATSSQMDRLKNNMQEGFGQTLAFGAIGAIGAAVTSAFSEVLKLDEAMTDVSIVSGKSREEMEAYRDAAGEAANNLGTTARDYLEASLIYEQQGGRAADYAQQLAKSTIIAANITGESMDQMSEYITAVMNGFDMLSTHGEEAGTHIADVLSNLGAVSGSGLDEMAKALQRTATVAKNSGYDFEDISAAIATVSETTRRSPEVVGTAFKSMLLSFQQLREGSEEDLTAFSSKVEKAFQLGGIADQMSIFDDNGRLREARDIMEDLGKNWGNMTKEARAVVSESIAGKEQAETLQAFLDNQDRYTELLGTAYDSAGVAARQQLIYMDSLEAKTEQLKNAWQGAADAIVDTDFFKGMIDQATRLLDIIGAQESAFAALSTALLPLVGIFAQLFGAKFMADSQQAKNAKNFSKNVAKRLEDEGRLTDELREQLEIGDEQQRIVRSLGEHSGQVYKQSQEQARALRDELQNAERVYDNLDEAAERANSDVMSGNTPEGVNSKKVQDAGQAAYDSALGPEVIALREATEATARLKAELATLNADPLVYDTNQVGGEIEGAKARLAEFKSMLERSGVPAEQLETTLNRITADLADPDIDLETLDTAYDEMIDDLETILQLQRQQRDDAEAGAAPNAAIAETEARLEELRNQLSNGTRDPDEIRQEADLANATAAELENAAARSQKLQRAVQVLGGAFTAGVPMLASYKAVLEGSTSAGEFMQTSIQSISTSLLLVPHPLAKVVGGIGLLIGTFADFRSEAEKAKALNEDVQRSYISLAETTGAAVNSTRDMKDAYMDLQTSGATSEQILAEGSEEAREAYLQLAEQIASSSPELIKYYDAEGNAIIDLTKNYEELMAAKLEEARATESILANNSSSFISQYSGEMVAATNDLTEANVELKRSQDDLAKAQELGDQEGIEEALKSIQEYTTQIADSNAKTKEVRDAIQANVINPITGASEAITKLTAAGDEGSIKAANALKRMSDSMLDDEWISTLASRGQTDDIEHMTDTVANLVEEIGALDPSKIEASVATFEKVMEQDPAAFAFAMQQANGSISEFILLTQELSDNNNNSTGGFIELTKRAQIFGDVYTEEIEKAGEATSKIEGDVVKTTAFVGGASAAVVGYAMSAGAALAPVTGGISILAGTVVSAGAAVVGATSSLIYYSDELEENYDKIKDNAELQEDQLDILESVADAYEQTSKTVEGYNANLKNLNKSQKTLDGMEKMLEGLSSVNPFTKEAMDSYNEFAKNNPDFAIVDSIKEGENALTALQDSYDAVAAHQSRAIAGMMMNNTDFYNQWLATNSNSIDWLSDNYNIDATNFTTLAELKTALEAKHAWEFQNYEQGKFQNGAVAMQQYSDANYKGVNDIGSYWSQGTNKWLSNLDLFSSESLSISDKVKIGFFMVVDGFTGLVEGIVNTVLMTWNTVVNGIYDGIEGVLKKLDGLAKVYEFFTGEKMLAGVDKGRDMLTVGMADFSTDLASKYGASKIAENETKKREAIDDIVYGSNLPAFKEFDGFNKSASDVGIKNYENAVKNRNKDNSKEIGSKGEKSKDKEEKEKKDVDNLELELDRYYKLDHVLGKIEDRLDTLGRLKDQAYGQDKINLMAKEQAQYAAQDKVLKSYVKALQAEQVEQKNLLKRQGFKFDGGGEITNLNARLTALQSAANKKTGEAKEKAIERVKELQEEAERYSEITFDLIPDKKQAIEEAKATIKEIEREKLEYKVEIRIEKSEMLTQVRDVMKEINGEDYNKLDENMLIVGDQLKANLDLVKYYQGLINEVNRNQKLSDADKQELLNEYKSSMLDAVGEAKSAYEELGEIQLDFISQTADMISEIGDGFDKIADKAATLADAYKKAYGPDSYDEISRLRDIQLKSLDAQALAASKARDEMLVYRNSLKEGTEAWKEATEIIDDLGDQIQDSLVEKIDLLKQKFEEFMEMVMIQSEKDVFGALGLDAYEETLNRTYEDQDKMLNTFDKLTQIGSVIAEVNQAIAKSTDPAQAERYAKFRDQELQTLMASGEVSKTQLERAQLLWDIEQKQQALEQRKNASRMAQLIRDENGNMSYEYVAKPDDAQTEKAEQELAQAESGVYEFDREQAKLAQQDIINIMKEADAKIAAYYADETLSDAERKAAIEAVQKQSIKDLAKAQEEMVLWTGHAVADGIDSLKGMFQLGDISFAPLGLDDDSVQKIFDALDAGTITVADMMNGNVSNFADKIGLTAKEADKVVGAIIGATGNEITSMTKQLTQVSNEWIGNFNSKLDALDNAYTKTQRDIKKTTDVLAGSTGNLNNQISENTRRANINTKAIRDQATQMVASTRVTNDGSSSFKTLTNTLVGRDGGSGTYGAMIKLRDEMNKKLQGAISETEKRSGILSRTAGKDGTSKSLNLMGDKANYAYKMSKQFDSGTMTTANKNIENMSGRAKDASKSIESMGEKAVISRGNIAGLSTALAALPGLNNNKKHYYTVTNKDGSIQSKSYKDKPKNAPGQYVGYFDTGGYTGEWTGSSGNQEGRPAIVHEKEIILNKDDTVNFLKGIELQRSMLKAVGGMENLASSFTRAGTGGSGMEQSVSIYAEFPNATNSNEIQDALSSLSLQAASHAFNKKN